jgi:ubiquitin
MSADWPVIVVGIGNSSFPVKVASSENDFLKTTVKQLKQKIYAIKDEIKPEDMRLCFAGTQLEDKKTLEDYNIQKKSTVYIVVRARGGTDRVPLPPQADGKQHQIDDFSVLFTDAPDAIMGYSEPEDPRRVRMSCGHGVDPSTLTNYCRSKLKDHIAKFTCPAIVDQKAANKVCGKEWTYADIRKAALLTEDEMKYFEYKISELAAMQFYDLKSCPGCNTCVERIDEKNLRVTCPICSKQKKKTWDFCWQCLKEWSGPTTSAVKCGYSLCVHPGLTALKDAPLINLYGKDVPNRRACPTCGKVIEHKQEGCKMMTCIRCKKEFCFICLLPSRECLKSAPGSWRGECKNPPAERQTSIPLWSRNN